MKESRAAYIRKLTEARDAVARQLEILEGGRPYYGINKEVQIADVLKRLRSTLSGLEECISAATDADEDSN